MKNLYYEYRTWQIFWGLFFDSKKELQKVLDDHNKQGWKVIQIQYGVIGNLPLGTSLFIAIITIVSLGFFSYWAGVSIVFEQSNSNNSAIGSSISIQNTRLDNHSSTKGNDEFDQIVNELEELISNAKNKKSSDGTGNYMVAEYLEKICKDSSSCYALIHRYQDIFKKSLIDDIQSLSNSYDNIRKILKPLIELNVLESRYPHEIKDQQK